jgi:hypothetical protein
MPADPTISYEQALEVFKDPKAIEQVQYKSQGFVKSLLASQKKYGKLTPKQSYWLRVYAEKVNGGPTQTAALVDPHTTPTAKPVIGSSPPPKLPYNNPNLLDGACFKVGTALIEMLEKATAHAKEKGAKKRPAIKFNKSENSPSVKFRLAAQTSKYNGCVLVTSGGGYSYNKFFGRITPHGEWVPTKSATPEIVEFVKNFAKEPHKLGSAYGLATFNCCFCAHDITTVDSKAMGYGPVCAEKYGLPWGKKATQEKLGKEDAEAAVAEAAATFQPKGSENAEYMKLPEDSTFQVGGSGSLFFENGKEAGPAVLVGPKKGGPSKWVKAGEALSEMAKVAKATGVPIKTGTQTKTGQKSVTTNIKDFAKIVQAVAGDEPMPDSPLGAAKKISQQITGIDYAKVENHVMEQIAAPAPSVANTPKPKPQDFGFTCATCMDTGKDLTPEGQLIDCPTCKE